MDYLFHYTSRQGAQDVIAGGKIKTNFRNQLFLTPDICSSGMNAADRLGIVGKPVEVVIILPTHYLPNNLEDRRDPEPIPHERDDVSGQIQRRGGGVQFILEQNVHLPRVGLVRGEWGAFRMEFP